jgi:hypothetical protein
MIYTMIKKIWLRKFLIINISIYILIFWYTFASDLNDIDNWDCWFVQETTWGNFWSIFESRSWQNEDIYPKESIKRALLNLKTYCCKKNIIWSDTPRCKYDKENWLFLETYPDSRFLYDHLVDVGFRRLDAMENLLYEWTTQDPIWKKWREFINKKWEQEEGTTPTDILPEFKEQRTINTNFILPYREDGNYNQQYQNEWISIASQYSTRPLINRYGNLCEIASYIYWYLWLNLWNYTRSNWYWVCSSLSKNLIARNITFTKAIVLKKSNKILYDNLNTHITNYMSQTRLEKLKQTILWIVQAFNVINKKVIKLIKECS